MFRGKSMHNGNIRVMFRILLYKGVCKVHKNCIQINIDLKEELKDVFLALLIN